MKKEIVIPRQKIEKVTELIKSINDEIALVGLERHAFVSVQLTRMSSCLSDDMNMINQMARSALSTSHLYSGMDHIVKLLSQICDLSEKNVLTVYAVWAYNEKDAERLSNDMSSLLKKIEDAGLNHEFIKSDVDTDCLYYPLRYKLTNKSDDQECSICGATREYVRDTFNRPVCNSCWVAALDNDKIDQNHKHNEND